MSWKTIMTVISRQDDETAARMTAPALEASIGLARREDANLEVLALGYDLTQPGYYFAGAGLMVLQDALMRVQSGAEEIEANVRERLSAEDIRWSVDQAVAQLGAIAPLVSQRARFADVVVLERPYGKGRTETDEAILETALFEASVPVLVVPDGMLELPNFDRICVAWNSSPEALSAIRQALPLLKKAAHVDITVIDPPAQGPERSDPGGALSQWLSRHGVRAEVSVLARTLPKVSEVLLRHARERDSDLIVMGAYGHSRFREAILGGATRDILEATTIPVFMAH